MSREPRSEGFVFHRRSGASSNRFEYVGNGLTQTEANRDNQSRTRYLYT